MTGTPITTRAIYMILPPSVLLLDMAGPLEVLRIAQRLGAAFSLHVVAPTSDVTTSLGIRFVDLEPLPDTLNAGDLIIIPGVLDETVYQAKVCREIVKFLKTVFDPAQHQIMSICSGAFLLGQAGLLNGRACTTHHVLTAELSAQFPLAQVVCDRVFVEDGRLLTSAGITAGLDVTLYWLAQHYGAPLAQTIARHMNIYFRRSPKDPALSPWLVGRNHVHAAIHKVQDRISADASAAHTMDDLAQIAYLSPRHLSRIFKEHTGMTVHDYQITLKHVLFEQWRTAGYAQEKAALAAGFSSAQAWRRSYRKMDSAGAS